MGLVAGIENLRFDRVEIVDHDTDVIEPAAQRVAVRLLLCRRSSGIDREIAVIRADMNGGAAELGFSLPAYVPAEQVAKAIRRF